MLNLQLQTQFFLKNKRLINLSLFCIGLETIVKWDIIITTATTAINTTTTTTAIINNFSSDIIFTLLNSYEKVY